MLQNDWIASLLGQWSWEITPASIILRICLSVLLAAVVGCERSSKRHSAGLRTFILVSLSSTVAMLIDLTLFEATGARMPAISAATVIGAAIVSGNSILFSSRGQIKGLTTSAGLWTCELIGLAVGAGLYTVTLVAFVATLCCVSLLPSLEKYLKDRSNHFDIHLELKSRSDLQDFVATVRQLGLRIDDIEANPAYLHSGLSVYTVSLTVANKELRRYRGHDEMIRALASLDYVSHVEETN